MLNSSISVRYESVVKGREDELARVKKKTHGDRHCIFTDEPAVHDEAGNGSRRCEGFQTENSLSLSLW